ncbi:MAG: hypothetical protein R2710_28110 [Acidimicrobiales bacterium]
MSTGRASPDQRDDGSRTGGRAPRGATAHHRRHRYDARPARPTLGLARFAVERAWQLGVPVTLVTHEASEPNPSHTSTSRFQIPYVPPTRRVEPRLAVRELEGPADLHRALASAIAGPSTDRALDGYHLVIGELTPDIP